METNKQQPLDIPKDLINIRKVLRAKNPKLLKVLPGFLIRYLERIVHAKEGNRILYQYRDKTGIPFVKAVMDEWNLKVEVEHQERIPESNRFVAASNHPLGGLDGIALLYLFGSRMKRKVISPANDLVMNVPHLHPVLIPINKHGSNKENVETLNKAFESDAGLLFFPAGLCSRKNKDGICDLPWQKTFIAKAKRYDRYILPIHVDGKNSSFFYNLANIRSKLGIKFNYEMVYLVDEMFKQKNKTLTVTIGHPIDTESLDKKRANDWQWAEAIKAYVYTLAEGNTDPFDPEYFLKQINAV